MKIIQEFLFLSFQTLAALPKVRFIEFVFGFDNISLFLLLLNSYRSELDSLHMSEMFLGHWHVSAFDTYFSHSLSKGR
jgi:hypothetical protein